MEELVGLGMTKMLPLHFACGWRTNLPRYEQWIETLTCSPFAGSFSPAMLESATP
jgi:hypothetical protein